METGSPFGRERARSPEGAGRAGSCDARGPPPRGPGLGGAAPSGPAGPATVPSRPRGPSHSLPLTPRPRPQVVESRPRFRGQVSGSRERRAPPLPRVPGKRRGSGGRAGGAARVPGLGGGARVLPAQPLPLRRWPHPLPIPWGPRGHGAVSSRAGGLVPPALGRGAPASRPPPAPAGRPPQRRGQR